MDGRDGAGRGQGGGRGGGAGAKRHSVTLTRRKTADNGESEAHRKTSISLSPNTVGERTVKRLRLSKALTIPESTSVYDVCRRMAARGVDAVLLTDSNALLSGILTDKDITMRVIACELKLDEVPASKVMTRNPSFVLSDSLAVEAMQKMVKGKFRHLPVVENGEVIALLDIAKCLYDAIARMEKVADQGEIIAAAVEGVEKNRGTSISAANTFIETLRERMFRPSLSTIISENSKVVAVYPEDSVLTAAKKMLEFKTSSAIVTVDEKPIGILTSRDILMRLVALNLAANVTPVEKVMTEKPQCGTVDMAILDALNIMHTGKFLHLPVVDGDGKIVTVVDVIHIVHATITTVGSTGGLGGEATSFVMQNFWDSAIANAHFDDDDDSHSNGSTKLGSEATTPVGRSAFYPTLALSNTFGFKIQDKHGRMHRFNCELSNLADLMTCILRRVGDDIDKDHLPLLMYEDEDHDNVILTSDSDLRAAVNHARQIGWKSLRLHLDHSGTGGSKRMGGDVITEHGHMDAWTAAFSTVAAGAAFVAGLGVMAFLKKSAS